MHGYPQHFARQGLHKADAAFDFGWLHGPNRVMDDDASGSDDPICPVNYEPSVEPGGDAGAVYGERDCREEKESNMGNNERSFWNKDQE